MTSSKKKKGAIAGFGFISGKGHFPAYLQRTDVEICAIADLSTDRRNYIQTHHPQVRVYETAHQLLEKEKELDFLDISTPPVDHAPLALMALEKGLHVLCEKPLTSTLAEAEELLKAAKRFKRVVFPCHNYKHAPVVKTVNEIIEKGEIGEVHGLTLNTFRTTHAKGVQEWKTDWRREKNISGGGIAMDHGSHTFYLTFLWHKAFPTAVTAKMFSVSPHWDTEDNFSCVLTFPKGYANAHLTWTAGVRKVIYTVQGAEGAITIDDDDIQVATHQAGTRRFQIQSHWNDASHVQWFNSMFDQFLKEIDQENWINQDLKEAYFCIQLIEKAYQSSRMGSQEIQLDTNFAFLK